jgi:hypothetical protein
MVDGSDYSQDTAMYIQSEGGEQILVSVRPDVPAEAIVETELDLLLPCSTTSATAISKCGLQRINFFNYCNMSQTLLVLQRLSICITNYADSQDFADG